MGCYRTLAACMTGLVLAGCGGGGSDQTYTISGTVTGLAGSGLVLQATGANTLAISASGAFQFPTALSNGSAFSISVQTQPTKPSQTCSIAPASGTISSASITNVVVACTTDNYKVGGTVSGLQGSGLVLSDNGSDSLNIAADGPFTFALPVSSGSSYAVTVKTQPTSSNSGLSESCTVVSGTGTVGSAAIDTIAINCSDAAITAGGTMMATSDGQSINLFRVSPSWSTAGSPPTPFQTISTPNITGLAVDPPGTVYYTANSGTAGSNSTFYVCPVPTPGQAYSCGTGLNTVAIAGGKLLTFDPSSGYLLAAKITAAGTTIVQFPASAGPTASSQQVIYTSEGTPATVNAQVIWSGNQEQVYVTEVPSGSSFGAGVKAYACNLPCNPGTQVDITQTLLSAAGGASLLSGALTAGDFGLVVGLANGYGATTAPASLPTALVCGSQLLTGPYSFSCTVSYDTVTSFPSLAGGLSPFIGTAGLAVDSTGQLYEAIALTDDGQTIAPSLLDGFSFLGFLGTSPNPFACSNDPATCPVNLLPSVPVSSNANAGPYQLAISSNCQQQPGSVASFCGTFSVTWTSQPGSNSTVIVNGLIWLSTLATASTVGPGGVGTAGLSGCEITILGSPGPESVLCDSGSYSTVTGSVGISVFGGRISFSGVISDNSVSGTTSGSGYIGTTGTGSGTFSAYALNP